MAKPPLKASEEVRKKVTASQAATKEISTDVIISSFLSEEDSVLILTKEQ